MAEKKYIEIEAAIEAIKRLYPSVPLVKLNIDKWHEKNKAYMECETAIERIPAADVRPVVYCKDCRNDCHCMIQDFMEDYGITPDDLNNFFCGYGEKEDKKDER